jgi:hypothetical protein
MLSFPTFAWLSHSGVLPGSVEAHGWGGFGIFLLAFAGFVFLLVVSDGNSHKIANGFCFAYGLLLVLNAVVYTFLRVANIIGPTAYAPNGTPFATLLALFYYGLAILGIIIAVNASEDKLF